MMLAIIATGASWGSVIGLLSSQRLSFAASPGDILPQFSDIHSYFTQRICVSERIMSIQAQALTPLTTEITCVEETTVLIVTLTVLGGEVDCVGEL